MTEQFSISTTPILADFVTLASLGVPDPLRSYKPYSKVRSLGDGGVRRAGWPVAVWHWSFLTSDQRTALKAYCAGAYAQNIYIHTIDESNSWVYAKTIMIWSPDDGEWQTNHVLPFDLMFRVKEIIEPTV